MQSQAADILAVISLALLLGGLNDHNPHQTLCIAAAVLLAIASYKTYP